MDQFAGLDVGSTTIKGVLVDCAGTLLRHYLAPLQGGYPAAIEAALRSLGSAIPDPGATGYGQDLVPGAGVRLTEISCHARGVAALIPAATHLLDIGGQDVKAIALGNDGRPQDFLMNDKCAAGTGRFLDVMARALGVEVEGFAALASRATRAAGINSMCAVFAESEVISLLAREVPAADVAAGLIEAIAGRTAMLVRRLGRPELLAVCGGVSLNGRVVEAIARSLDVPVTVPSLPQHTAALGVALASRDAALNA